MPLTLHTNAPSATDTSWSVPLSHADLPALSACELCPPVDVSVIDSVLPLSACTTQALSCEPPSTTFHVRWVALLRASMWNRLPAAVPEAEPVLSALSEVDELDEDDELFCPQKVST